MLYIGHHFFGSGNVGDDLMLGGFLRAARTALGCTSYACSSPFDLACQGLRFPEIQWLPYDRATRAAAIELSEAWLGVGDTPFQTDVGAWFLDHLAEDMELCRQFNKPMYFIAVGLNNRAAIDHPHTRALVRHARAIWTRDELTARQLSVIREVTPGADLASVFLADRTVRLIEAGTLAFLLNFEDAGAFTVQAICDVMDATPELRHLWLVQEVRALPGSEREIYDGLPAAYRARLEVRAPDYAHASLDGLVDVWGAPELVVTSRYHGALAAAWMGARSVIIERNDKLTGLVEQLDLLSAKDFRSARAVLDLCARARAVSRPALLELSALASRSVEALADALGRPRF